MPSILLYGDGASLACHTPSPICRHSSSSSSWANKRHMVQLCHPEGLICGKNRLACLGHASNQPRHLVHHVSTGNKARYRPIIAAQPSARPSSDSEKLQFDVVIIGAGIIGLSIANLLLSRTHFSVAVVDAARPCAGATGAGQGYIWLGHKPPSGVSWPLSKRSKQLWEEFAEGLQSSGLDPSAAIGYKKTGSLLFGSTSEQACALRARVEALHKEGVHAEYLDSTAVSEVEPQLKVGPEGSAILTLGDCQIDAHLAASFIAGENRKYCASGRFQELFYDPAVDFLWSDQYPHIVGVQTARRSVYCKETLVMAAGAWSGLLMEDAFKRASLPYVLPTKPRKGHLLVFEGLSQVSLKHGLMEFAYEKLADSSDLYGVAATATIDAEGRLLLGSSRQFAGFDFNLQYDVMESILKRVTKFLPVLGSTHLAEALREGTVRVGHRPYVPDGRPMIGKIPGLEGILLATGHEGEGLSLALGTAEIVVNMLLDEEPAVDPSPFCPAERLVPPPKPIEAVH